MTDDEVVAYLVGDAVAPLTGGERARVERTRSLLAEPGLWVEPSPELEQRVIDAVLGSGGHGSEPLADADATPGPTGPAGSAGVDDLAARRARRRPVRAALIGAAAAVILAVGVGAVVVSQRDQPTTFAAALAGTELAPAAKGSVTMTKTTSGWRIHVQATGLPRLDGGRYYQGWLKDAAGTLVPIGTFNEGTDVTLWSGVPPSDFPTITITRQDATAGPASSGQKVLTGTTHQTH